MQRQQLIGISLGTNQLSNPGDLMTDRRYFAYLLRCWQSSEEGKLVWRASLEDPHTGERIGFATLEAAVAFLRERLWTICQRPGDYQAPADQAE